jgi:hypothetical protein
MSTAAVDADERMGARGWRARAQLDLAHALLQRGHARDRARARQLAREAKDALERFAGVAAEPSLWIGSKKLPE